MKHIRSPVAFVCATFSEVASPDAFSGPLYERSDVPRSVREDK
eukprot:CAMPEP_0194031526 /NCGR_PEP_ID=MMETSP0009_2-20130614/4687_1 /TAXON_ID=210454 /ORGANISM="Grammatophora oceanica, Strain CCMP 410" /LENGTH=42 /DNA_ID= /DNA_START= /DNA_END= /DNA_ORIENTATION=